jgi:hypothetical protein
MVKLFKLAMIVICLLLAVGYLLEILEMFPSWRALPQNVQLFGYGGLGFLAFWLVFRKHLAAFAVFEHELTHLLVAKVFFLKTLHFEVSPRKHIQGKVVVGVDGEGKVTRVMSVVFSLAPYYFPTLMLLVFATYPLIGRLAPWLFAFLVGFTVMYHLLTTFWEFGFHQADIQRHGEYFSTAFILLGNIMFVGVALIVILYGFHDIPAFLLSGLLNIVGG